MRLLTHGEEDRTLGGPTIRVPRTAQALRDLGVEARATHYDPRQTISEDTAHLFNVWPPLSALAALRHLKSTGKTTVFSPIYLDFSKRAFWQDSLPNLAKADPEEIARAYADTRIDMSGRGRLAEIVPGYHGMIREMFTLADHVLFLSEAERTALAQIGATVPPDRSSLILNPVDTDLWSQNDPALFRDTYLSKRPGPPDYVICVGRIEERKNQMMLARALHGLSVRLVLIGHEGSPAYARQVRDIAGPGTLILGRLDPAGEMLRSAVAGASAFALPSWAEGAPLAALEAAACGTPLVLGDNGASRSYLGDLAAYCDPWDPDSIRDAVSRALDLKDDTEHAGALIAQMEQMHGWTRYAKETAAAYDHARKASKVAPPPAKAPGPTQKPRDIVVDITSAMSDAAHPLSDQDRSAALLMETLAGAGQRLRMIWWDAELRRFFEVPHRLRTISQARHYIRQGTGPDRGEDVWPASDVTLLTVGTAWAEDMRHLHDLADLKIRTGCRVLALMQGLMPLAQGFRYDVEQVSLMRSGAAQISTLADALLVMSEASARTLCTLNAEAGNSPPDIHVLPAIVPTAPQDMAEPQDAVQKLCARTRFCLAVGDLGPQSNTDMLHRIWAWLADQEDTPDLHLVIAGGLGQGGQDLAARIARDPRVCDRIHILTGTDAVDRAALYQACLCTLVPQHDPDAIRFVTESRAFGKPCLASLSVDPDADDLVTALHPDDTAAWRQGILAMTGQGASASQTRTDGESTAELVARIHEIFTAPTMNRSHGTPLAGEVVRAGLGSGLLDLHFEKGWHPAEDWGRLSAAPNASVSLCLRKVVRPSMTHVPVALRLRGSDLTDGAGRLIVSIADQTVFETRRAGPAVPDTIFLSVPVSALDEDRLSVTIQSTPSAARIGLVAIIPLDPDFNNPLMAARHPDIWSDGTESAHINLMRPDHLSAIGPNLITFPAWGAGVADGAFDLWLPLIPGAGAQELEIGLRPVATARTPVEATFYLNGQALHTQTWTDNMPDTVALTLPAEALAISGPAVLRIETGSAQSPSDLHLGPTTGIAGLGVFDLTLTPDRVG